MNVLNPWAVLLGAAVSAPIWWSALAEDRMPVDAAATRSLLALLVCSAGVGLVGKLIAAYAKPAAGEAEGPEDGPEGERRRAGDRSPGPGEFPG